VCFAATAARSEASRHSPRRWPMRYVFVATRETGGLGPSRGEGSRARRAALQQVRSARVREAVVAARDALDRHSGQAALERPISQYARDGIDRSYVNRATTTRRQRRFLIWEEFMPRLVGFSRFDALLDEQIDEGWSYGGVPGPGSMSSRTVTQMSRSFGCPTGYHGYHTVRLCAAGTDNRQNHRKLGSASENCGKLKPVAPDPLRLDVATA
jgi:hypothetical protein